jgi:3-methyladenine DNA glycosylase/8-oxoguanine DNA glycosylase
MHIRRTKTVEIMPSAPFAFDPTFHKPDHFTSGDNLWEPGTRWQTLNWWGIPLGLKFVNNGTVDNPQIMLEIFSETQLPEQVIDSLVSEIRYRYNLDLDLADFYKRSQKDTILAAIIGRLRGMRPGHPSSLYEYLIIGIVLQNDPVRRSVQMFKALLENYGTLLEFDNKELWCYWIPGGLQDISEEELRALKIGYRAKFIKRIDEYFAQNLIDEEELRKEDRETQMRELLKLYGVGPATVWYLLFDVFHHWDFFNHISPWEQKIYSKLFFDREPEDPVPVDKLLKHFERYGKYKQLAVHYIWEDLFWRRESEHVPWLEREIRV